MSQRIQTWLLRNTGGLQTLVNDKLAKRSGLIGRIFKGLEIGPRQFSQHSLHRVFRVVNYFWVQTFHTLAVMRPVFSRFVGVSNGPLNYSGLMLYFFLTGCVIARFRFIRVRDTLVFNAQDNPEFWYSRYNLMFPPSFLHNRLSAHYIEINHIFSIEMMKKYQHVRKDVLADRERYSDEEKRTKYILNENYIYEPLGADDGKI
jgi:hypothetical protein